MISEQERSQTLDLVLTKISALCYILFTVQIKSLVFISQATLAVGRKMADRKMAAAAF